MQKLHNIIFGIFCLLIATNTYSFNTNYTNPTILENAEGLNPKVLKLGLTAYEHARELGLDKQEILTIVDYSKPSYEKRLWVIDVRNKKVLFHTLVAHGKGSGQTRAERFSNASLSHASSIGVFSTGHDYYGKHGYSLRLNGLEPHFNDKAYKRSIVIHDGWYVSENFVKKHGRIGRSWGCLALDKKVSKKVIRTIKDGTIIFSYYPDKQWITQSKFLKMA